MIRVDRNDKDVNEHQRPWPSNITFKQKLK